MQALLQFNTPAFTRLPVELLTMIIDQRHSDAQGTDIIDHSTLKSLRLACRQYADLPRLLEKLFLCIRLEASSDRVLAETLDFSVMKPYIKKVVMAPSKYSWAMTYDLFEDIILVTPLRDFCHEMARKKSEMQRAGEDVSGITPLGRDQIAELGMRGFAQRYMNGKMPFSTVEIREWFEHYMQHARRTQAMYEERQVQRTWTRVLTQLPGVHAFEVGRWDFEGKGVSTWKDWGCDVQPHEHHYGKGHKIVDCQRLQEPVGEALFRAAIASLVAARSKIFHLDIKHIVNGKFDWTINGELHDLDLCNLQTLSFEPSGADSGEHYDRDSERQAAFDTSCCVAITHLLRKGGADLHNLSLFPDSFCYSMTWPSLEIVNKKNALALTALRRFTTSLTLKLSSFALFLHQCPVLEYLRLNSCHGKDGTWRELWDAIRNHSSRMTLEFEQIPCNSYTEATIYHHTGKESSAEFEDDPWININYSLENYLSKRRHWDRTLRMWFEDGDGESTSSESDGEESGHEDVDVDEDIDEDESTDANSTGEDMDGGSAVEDLSG